MNKVYDKEVFRKRTLRAGAKVRDARFTQCTFDNCWTDPEAFSFVERVTFERTTLKTKAVDSIVCRDVTIDTCKGATVFTVTNCLFDRVKLVGTFGSWMIIQEPESLSPEQAELAATFYGDVEWALDIREAQFKTLTLRGVPGDKVRRNPARHFLLRKDRLLADPSWRDFPELLVDELSDSLEFPDESEILVAGDLSKYFESRLSALNMLRDAGFAE